MPRPSRKIAIMQAAARLFAAKGYSAVSVRDIAAEMELTPASLYYYFPDKETLYRQTLVMVFTGVQSAFKAPQGTTGIEKMECLIRNVVTYCCGNPIFTRLLLRELNEGLEERLHFLADSVFATPPRELHQDTCPVRDPGYGTDHGIHRKFPHRLPAAQPGIAQPPALCRPSPDGRRHRGTDMRPDPPGTPALNRRWAFQAARTTALSRISWPQNGRTSASVAPRKAISI